VTENVGRFTECSLCKPNFSPDEDNKNCFESFANKCEVF